MTDFWARALGAPTPTPAPAPVPAPAAAPSPGSWWAPQSPPAAAVPAAVPLAQPPQVPSHLAAHTRHACGPCPECGGENYYEVDQRQGPRCYGCGYAGSGRIRNSTQGVTLPSDPNAAPAKAARQIPGLGYRPDIVVGKI